MERLFGAGEVGWVHQRMLFDWFGNTRQAVYAAFLRTTFYTLFTPDMRWIRVNN